MNIVLAGAAGFIGSNLAKDFLRSGHRVIGIDNLITGSMNNINSLDCYEHFSFIEEDIVNILDMEEDIDWILHFASPASPIKYCKFPIETMETNGRGTHNLLNIAQKKNAKFLFASTSEVYGNPEVHPQNEKYWGRVNPIGIRSCYDESKRYAEALVCSMHRKYDLSVRIIRIFNTYGPQMQLSDGRIVTNFIDQILHNRPLSIYGNGKQTRSLQYIDDLVAGIKKVMNSNYSYPINLGNTEEYTIYEIAQMLSKISSQELKVEYKELPEDDPDRRKPDISLAKSILHWEPVISLEEGLRRTWNYYAKQEREICKKKKLD